MKICESVAIISLIPLGLYPEVVYFRKKTGALDTANDNNVFNLDKNWSLTANVNYTSAKPSAQGKDSRFSTRNMSIKKTILEGKGSIGFQWQFINFGNMGSNQQRITTWGSDFYTTTNYNYESNVLLLNFSYNFNKFASKIYCQPANLKKNFSIVTIKYPGFETIFGN